MSEQLLKELIAKVDALAAKINRVAGVAPAWKLDHEKGDPDVRFDPKIWRGESYKQRRFSECPPEFLDMLAESYDWMADNPKEGKEKYAGRDRETASLARGWAERKRLGWKPRNAPAPAARHGGGYGASGGYGGNGGGYGNGRAADAPPGGGRDFGAGGGAAPNPDDDGRGGGFGDDEIPF